MKKKGWYRSDEGSEIQKNYLVVIRSDRACTRPYGPLRRILTACNPRRATRTMTTRATSRRRSKKFLQSLQRADFQKQLADMAQSELVSLLAMRDVFVGDAFGKPELAVMLADILEQEGAWVPAAPTQQRAAQPSVDAVAPSSSSSPSSAPSQPPPPPKGWRPTPARPAPQSNPMFKSAKKKVSSIPNVRGTAHNMILLASTSFPLCRYFWSAH